MKKNFISLTFIAATAQSLFGALAPAPMSISLPSCYVPSSATVMVPAEGQVKLCAANATHAVAIDSHDVHFVPMPHISGKSTDISPWMLQNFLMDHGMNIALESARLAELPVIKADDLHKVLEKMAVTFDGLAASPTGLFGFAKKLYRNFTQSECEFEKDIEHLAAQAQKNKLTLRVGVQGLGGVEPVFVSAPSLSTIYLAIGSLIRNIKTAVALHDKAATCSARSFDFGLHIEPVDAPELAQAEHDASSTLLKVTPTVAHALAYCKNDKNCAESCGCQGACPRTIKQTECAFGHMLRGLRWHMIKNTDHLRRIFDEILTRSQVHRDYDEFFHAYQGDLTILFDVMTELASRANLVGTDNPAPLFLRLLSKNFNLHGPDIGFFLKKTFQPMLGDHDGLAKELVLSTNIALMGNLDVAGESSFDYFLGGFSNSRPSIDGSLKVLFDTFNLPCSYVDEIVKLYEPYAELNAGHLCQIFIPRDKTHDCAYLSKAFGFPVMQESFAPNTVDLATVFGALPRHADGQFDQVNKLQARVLLNPRLAKDFIFYRYYATPEAARAARAVQEKLRQLFDRLFVSERHNSNAILVERIRAGQKDAVAEGRQRLSAADISPKDKTAVCEALAEQGMLPSQCEDLILKSITTQFSSKDCYLRRNACAFLIILINNEVLSAENLEKILSIALQGFLFSKGIFVENPPEIMTTLSITSKIMTTFIDKGVFLQTIVDAAVNGFSSKNPDVSDNAFILLARLLDKGIPAESLQKIYDVAMQGLLSERRSRDGYDNAGHLLNQLSNHGYQPATWFFRKKKLHSLVSRLYSLVPRLGALGASGIAIIKAVSFFRRVRH